MDGRITACGSAGAGLVAAGLTGQVQFDKDGSLAASGNLYWDSANNRLGIGSAAPAYTLDIYNFTQTALRAYTSYGNPAATFTSGNGMAIMASGSGSGAIGLFGTTSGTSAVAGVYGAAASSGVGVQGTANGGNGAGVYGLSNSGGAYGVKGVGYYASSGYFGAANSAQHPTLVIQQYTGAPDDLTEWQNGSGAVMDVVQSNGNMGIGTASPAATLDINGFIRLAKNTGQPATCSASNDGAIALTAAYTLCVCKNGTGWVTEATGLTSCTW